MKGLLNCFEGKNVLIRTVTYHWVGKLEGIEDGVATLSTASYIGDTGRYSTILNEGWDSYSEIEPVPGEGLACLNSDAIVDVVEWPHDLPTKQV